MKRLICVWALAAFCCLQVAPSPVEAAPSKQKDSLSSKTKKTTAQKRKAVAAATAATAVTGTHIARDGEAEARLIDVYKLIGQSRLREARTRAQTLVRDHPNFQLAQLVYGDLLSAAARPLRSVGDVPDALAQSGAATLADLREESQQRMRALRERPPAGAIPAQFLALSPRNRHAIAVDTARSRLYLFENGAHGLHLLADYYISVGKAGVGKEVEGDARTPLGVYFITRQVERSVLTDFYGSGALPINYPNPYDTQRGKTGSGIWLHGTPPKQFSRAPRATDGCVVLTNPDLERLLKTVQARTTPVVIAQNLLWVSSQAQQPQMRQFDDLLQNWREARASGDWNRLQDFYSVDFSSNGKPTKDWQTSLRNEQQQLKGRQLRLTEMSLLRWSDAADTLVATFDEVVDGKRSATRRQYWVRQGTRWKIFYEGVIG